jgi:hypothetical protein
LLGHKFLCPSTNGGEQLYPQDRPPIADNPGEGGFFVAFAIKMAGSLQSAAQAVTAGKTQIGSLRISVIHPILDANP